MSNLVIGSILDTKYKIEDLIGTGGMAHVYKATNLQTNKTVAIKVLKEEFAKDAGFVRRFKSEAQAVLHLSHENIVSSLDVGNVGDTYYIVLEYVSGITLKQKIKESAPFDNRTTIDIALQLSEALAHAHDRNLIHRDVKPQNIIINDHDHIKLADFGIARFADASTVTYAGNNVLGSVHYISPEQARGETVDATSDIYSLGIVIYEMVTGRVPFDSDNTVSVAIKQIQEDIFPPINLNPRIGAALNGVILKATQKDKNLRYQSMHELRKDLVRAYKEPNKNFVTFDAPKKKSLLGAQRDVFGRIMNIVVATAIAIGLLISVFFIVRTIIEKSSADSVRYVPTLIKKTEAEAIETCDRFDLILLVNTRVSSEEVPEGIVYEQEPKSGNTVKAGDTIYVSVSAGMPLIDMPQLTEISLEDAKTMIARYGLVLSDVNYEYSDLPDGMVIGQYPDSGTAVENGDNVEIWVSGDVGERETMPSFIGTDVSAVIDQITSMDFAGILVRFVPDSTEQSGTVINQLPTASEFTLRTNNVEVWVAGMLTGDYSVEQTIDISVPEGNSTVIVVVDTGLVDYVVYEQVLSSGKHTLPISFASDWKTELALGVYINGELDRTITIQPKRKID